MADDTPADPFAAGMANFKDTTQWLVASTVAIAAGVLAGSPLTGLGDLDWGPRLGFAIGCAAIAFLLLGVILWQALAVVAADTTSISALAAASGKEAEVRRRLEAKMKDGMPFGCETMALLVLEEELRYADTSADGERRRQEFDAAIAEFNKALGFYYKHDRFIRMRDTVVRLMPVVILAIGGFAWATNPPEEAKALTEKPRFVTPSVDQADMAALGAQFTPACYPPDSGGRTPIRAIVDAEFPDGRSELITVPAGPGCAPIRLTQQNGRIFATD